MWLGRDADGTLKLFLRSPFRDPFFGVQNGAWVSESDCDFLVIDKNLFPNFQWEDGAVELDVKALEKIMNTFII